MHGFSKGAIALSVFLYSLFSWGEALPPISVQMLEGATLCLDLRTDTGLEGSYKKLSGPDWFTLETSGAACLEESAPAGNHSAEIEVTTSELTATAALNVEVISKASVLTLSGDSGKPINEDLRTLSGLDGTFKIAATQPRWLEISPEGLLSGTPRWGGKYELLLLVDTDSGTVSLNVILDITYPEMKNILSLSLYTSFVIDSTGIQGWGQQRSKLLQIPAFTSPRLLSVGNYHACAIDGKDLKCWGENQYGQATVPPSISNPVYVSAGVYHTCAIDDNGLQCWGHNNYKQTDVPASAADAKRVAAGSNHTCAILQSGQVECWGYDAYGETKAPVMASAQEVTASNYYSCALDETDVKCWGYNYSKQTEVPLLSNPKQLSSGPSHSCAIDDSGVHCWGYNGNGQTNVPALQHPREVSAGGSHTCAIDDNGVQCWGNNSYGQTDVPPTVSIGGLL